MSVFCKLRLTTMCKRFPILDQMTRLSVDFRYHILHPGTPIDFVPSQVIDTELIVDLAVGTILKHFGCAEKAATNRYLQFLIRM